MSSERYRTFPRGMVLGLTMAETVLLIVFALLLAFAALFGWQQEESRREREKLEDRLAEHGITPGASMAVEKTDGERWRELVRVVEVDIHDESPDAILVLLEIADQWGDEDSPARRLAGALSESGADASPATIEQLVSVTEMARQSGMSPEELRSRMEEESAALATADLADALRAAGLEGTPEELQDLADLAEVAADTGVTPDDLRRDVAATFRDPVTRDLHRALSRANVDATPSALRDLVETADALAEAGLTAAEVRRAMATDVGKDAAVEMLGAALDDAGIAVTPQRLRELSALADAAAKADVTPEEIHDLLRAAAVSGGRGTEHPSCLNTGRGGTAYLFDVALSAQGFFVQPTRAAPYAPERSTPPPAVALDSLSLGEWLGDEDFSEQTSPIRQWSDANECVLFVRVWDQTPPVGKQLYKDRMRTLESVFYKLEVSSGPPPTDSATSSGRP